MLSCITVKRRGVVSKADIFKYELSFIKDSKIREFTIKAIEVLPDYFF